MTNESELNVTDAKSLAAIKPFIGALQTFVKKNICNGNTMTAGTIYEVFSKESKCGLDSESFVKGFRVAVRVGLITGIESAKRAGYKEAGTALMKSANDDVLEDIQPYLEGIQAFIDKHIQGDTRMTAAVIYEKFKKTVKCELSEEDFVKSFRLAIREGKIQGLESAYRFGYKRIGTKVVTDDDDGDDSEKTGHDICEVVIDERRKLVALDRHCWGLQVRRDTGSWATEAYFPNIKSGLEGVARRLLDDEMKGVSKFMLKDFISRIVDAEARITALLMQIMPEKKERVRVKEVDEEKAA
jgi:hypothetical protein